MEQPRSSEDGAQTSLHADPTYVSNVQYFSEAPDHYPGQSHTEHPPYTSCHSREEDMEDDFDEETLRKMHGECDEQQYFAHQVSPQDYARLTAEYTQQAVETLTRSREYQRVYTRCQLCWCSWSEEQYNESCMECGGHGMTRPCPICNGKCSSEWTREVQLSHSMHEAHWDGECSLPWAEKQGYMYRALIDDVSEDSLLDGMEELTT